jgi:hypothetical protein
VTFSLLLLLSAGAIAAPETTLATTGPSDFLAPSPYQVPMKVEQLYGVVQFSGYEQGFQSIWIATLYNFHQTKAKVMSIDVLAQTGSLLLGHLFLTRS